MGKKGLKFFLFIVNILFFIAGLVTFAIGVWTATDRIFMSDIIGSNLYSSASYMMIISGIVITLVSILGCVTSWREMRFGVLIYFIILLFIFVFLVIASILAVVFRGELEDVMSKSMGETLIKQYGNDIERNAENRAVTKAWDLTQERLECCGVDSRGWEIYRESRWYRDQPNTAIKFVPVSCCKNIHVNRITRTRHCQETTMGPPAVTEGGKNDYLFYQGCYDAAYTFVMDQAGILLAIGFSFSIVLICGLVLSLCLFRYIKRTPTENRATSAPL
ncbi:CD151 antigen [Octopus sinensis]|uniref:Tetraspanin n=1 Tax=Octopus sinensis TaxID=2607531 RepID=A0A6P7SF83_9MOLL|nr:CD151 antigen [Octopus sinensis]XP_036358902.1 CD151 antigen [Octopus sinensis]